MAKHLSKERERYLAARRELNPRTTQAKSSHEPLSHDIMGPDPHVIGIVPGDWSQYGGPLYTLPAHDQGEHPWYAHDNLWHFKYSADKRAQFNNALEHLNNLLLTAEVACFREVSCLFFMYQEEICKIEEHMWEAGQLKDTSAQRLESANALDRIEAAVEELDRQAVARQVCTECGHST